MSGDWIDNPDVQAWARKVSSELVPMLRASSATVSLVPEIAGRSNVKMAVELGMSIMLDKPIVLVVFPGRQIPPKLVQIADAIVEVGEEIDADAMKRVQAAVELVTGGDA